MLRTIKPTTVNQRIYLSEYALGDGAGGGELFWLNSTSTVDDGITFFRVDGTGGWARDVSAGINGMWAGDLLSGDATEKLNMLSAAACRRKTALILPCGTITVSGTWLIDGDDAMIYGQGMANTKIFGDSSTTEPVILVKKSDYDTNKTRTRNFKLRDVQISGQAVDDSGVTWSPRDLLHMYAVGFDFDVSDVWFNNFGRRAVYAVDIWDGDFRNCKIHAGGVDKTWVSESIRHAICIMRDADNSNAIRFTNCHFEGLRQGALYSQDYNHSFFLTNCKFETINSDASYSAINPIYIGDNFRNFTMFGGLVTLNQHAKYMHFVRATSADNTTITDVKFTSPQNDNGAACIWVAPGGQGTGPVVNSHFDVRGDITDADGNIVYPISSGGSTNFSTSTVKLYNPGSTFNLGGNGNDVSNVSVYTLGTNGSQTFIHQSNPTNKTRGIRVSGIVNVDGLSQFTNLSSLFDPRQVAILKNISTSQVSPGENINGASLIPCDLSGNVSGNAPDGVWRAISYVPASSAGLFERVR